MGLALEVGVLVDLEDNDPEAFEDQVAVFERLNGYLKSRGLPAHDEPVHCEAWSADMLGYSGHHELRRLAAYLDCGADLPAPAQLDGAEDECLANYYAALEDRGLGWLRRFFGPKRSFRREFDHLINHSDAEGLWQRYGRESYGCVTLRHACRHAIAQRAAVVFT